MWSTSFKSYTTFPSSFEIGAYSLTMDTVDFDPPINVADSPSTVKAGGLTQAGLFFHLFNTWQP
jgi:hypothetical protein